MCIQLIPNSFPIAILAQGIYPDTSPASLLSDVAMKVFFFLAWLAAVCLADEAQQLRGAKAVTAAPNVAKEAGAAKGDEKEPEVGAVAKEPVPEAKEGKEGEEAKSSENEAPEQTAKDAGAKEPAKPAVKPEDSSVGEPQAEWYYYPMEEAWEYGPDFGEEERAYWEDFEAPYEVFEGPGPDEVGVVVPEDSEMPEPVPAAEKAAVTAATAASGPPAPASLIRRWGGRGRPGRWGRRPGRWGRPGRRPWGRPIYRPRPYYRPGWGGGCLRWAYYYGGRYCTWWGRWASERSRPLWFWSYHKPRNQQSSRWSYAFCNFCSISMGIHCECYMIITPSRVLASVRYSRALQISRAVPVAFDALKL